MIEEEFTSTFGVGLNNYFINRGYSELLYNGHKRVGYEDDDVIDYLSFTFMKTETPLNGVVYDGGIHASRKLKKIECYWEDYKEYLAIPGDTTPTIGSRPKDLDGNLIATFTIEDKINFNEIIDESIESIVKIHKEIIYRDLEYQSNLFLLDKLHNYPFDKMYASHESRFRKMIYSRLLGNDQFDDIYNMLFNKYKKVFEFEPNDQRKNIWG